MKKRQYVDYDLQLKISKWLARYSLSKDRMADEQIDKLVQAYSDSYMESAKDLIVSVLQPHEQNQIESMEG